MSDSDDKEHVNIKEALFKRLKNLVPGKKAAILPQAAWLCLLLLVFWVSAFISWQVLSKADFFYSYWYQVIAIDAHIEQYAPQNRFKTGFEHTTDAERYALFGKIVAAVNNHGQGLASITFENHDQGGGKEALLTRAEILHLEDVAALVACFKKSSWLVLMVSLFFLLVVVKSKFAAPTLFHILTLLIVWVLLVLGLVVLMGPVNVFYRLHTLVFPEDHQWFFYYQESLMSTMMKAPDLFAYIGACWLLFSFVLTLFLYWLMVKSHYLLSKKKQ